MKDWGKLLGDVPSATAILDRFLHNAEVIAITGRSYRLRNRAAAADDTPPKQQKGRRSTADGQVGSPPEDSDDVTPLSSGAGAQPTPTT